MGYFKSVILIGAVAFSASAFGQWQWLDHDGKKVFSDRPPPADIADKNILKRPPGSRPAMPSAALAASAAPGASAAIPKISGVDPALEEKKKQAEATEAAKKKQEAEQLVVARMENCTRAKQAKATFDSGVRITRTNAQGEREYLDDNARAAETKRLQEIIMTDCR
ncbi:DUF4124 domain-containing protein [Variovorax sp. HJSM1_2]|uniref:DUF4124 domain-containing protein n=1 Tax=Variovorax sp. HJSM1_2 TaxID=3366263 RepID=UPI003BBC1A56